MTDHETTGYWRRLWGALKRALLGKSSSDYMKRFCGGYDYRAMAAERSGETLAPGPASETEPVHGWTQPQLKDFLARNPAYEAIYQAKLNNRGVLPLRPQVNSLKRAQVDKPSTPGPVPEQTQREERWENEGGGLERSRK
jgi:hypothetical protein